ncbi:MAG: phage late control D family protein [Candidatus Binatia bacterium]
MGIVTVRDESKRQGDFYIPRCEIKIAGANLPQNVLRDVLQVTYSDDVEKLDSFELTVNNWDTEKQKFKYCGSETTDSLAKNPLHQLFNPSRHEVEVYLGYGGTLSLMMKGNFTTMEPNFPNSGGPTLSVRGLNVLDTLRREPFTQSWTNKKPSEIAKGFEKLPEKRFPLDVEIDDNALQTEKEIQYIAQSNQCDINFLLVLAGRVGYVIFVKEEERKKGQVIKKRRLYFGPSDANQPRLRPVTFELKWGLSLIDFKPTLTTANQVKNVTVTGWNRSTKQPITGKASIDDPKFKLNRDLRKQLENSDAREERVVDEPVFTQGQADERAEAIMLDRSKDHVKASGTCVGLPDLRAGQRVKIAGLGARFSGEYFVTDTTHTINDSGYITKFNARREDPGK